MSIDLIIFDCDGVLVDSETIYIAAELECLERAGVTISRSDYLREMVGLAPADWQVKVEGLILQRTGCAAPATLFEDLSRSTLIALEERLAALPEARQVIAGLMATCCVASNTGLSRLDWKLRHTGLWELFAPRIFSADMVTQGKPAPDLFLHAASSLCTAPSACVVIEDSTHGVSAAKAAGMRVIGFTAAAHHEDRTGATLRQCGADLIVDSYTRLPAAIAALS